MKMTEKLGLVDANIAIVDDTIVIQFYNTSQIEVLNEINGTTVCVNIQNGSVTYSSESGKITKCLKGLSKQISKKVKKITNKLEMMHSVGIDDVTRTKKLLDTVASILHDDLSKFQNCVMNKFNIDYSYVKSLNKTNKKDLFTEKYHEIRAAYEYIYNLYVQLYSKIVSEDILSYFKKYFIKELEERKTIGIFSFVNVFLFPEFNIESTDTSGCIIDMNEFLEEYTNDIYYKPYIMKITESSTNLRPDYCYFITKDGLVTVNSVIATALSKFIKYLKYEWNLDLFEVYNNETNLNNLYEMMSYPFVVEVGKVLNLYYVDECSTDYEYAYGYFYIYGDDNNLESCVTKDPRTVHKFYSSDCNCRLFLITLNLEAINHYVDLIEQAHGAEYSCDLFFLETCDIEDDYVTIGRRIVSNVELIKYSPSDLPPEVFPTLCNGDIILLDKPYGTSITRSYLNLYSIIYAIDNGVSLTNPGEGLYLVVGEVNNYVFKFKVYEVYKSIFGINKGPIISTESEYFGKKNGFTVWILEAPYQDTFRFIDMYSKYLITGDLTKNTLKIPLCVFWDIYSIECPYCRYLILVDVYDGSTFKYVIENCPTCPLDGYVKYSYDINKLNIYENLQNIILSVGDNGCVLEPNGETYNAVEYKGVYVDKKVLQYGIDPAVIYALGKSLGWFYGDIITYYDSFQYKILYVDVKSKFEYIDIDYKNVSSIGFTYETIEFTKNLKCKVKYTDGTEKTITVSELIDELLDVICREYPKLRDYYQVLYVTMLCNMSMYIFSIYDAIIIDGSTNINNDYFFGNLNIISCEIPITICGNNYKLIIDRKGFKVCQGSNDDVTVINFLDGSISLHYRINIDEDASIILNKCYTGGFGTPLLYLIPAIKIVRR